MLPRALDAGVPAASVTADEAYGRTTSSVPSWKACRIGYVLAVACRQTIPPTVGTSRADVLASRRLRTPGNAVSCGDGAKGPRLFDSAVASLPTHADTTPPGWSRWLLVRRSLTPNSKGELELAYYFCSLQQEPPMMSLSTLPGRGRRSRNASRPPRPSSDSTITRSAATTPGTGTSPWPCSPTPTSPSPRRSPQKSWQRPHPTHARRGQASPGTPDHHHPHPRHDLGLVPLAPTPPIPRPTSPLPAQTHP